MGLIFLRNRVSGVAPFDPASLFASGEEGVWYEPSTTTAFLSTTDLTPCGYGDACGFLLDKSQGAGYSGGSFTGLGSELVAGGEFNDAGDLAEWTATAATTISLSSNAILSTATATAGFYQDISTVSGTQYVISWDYTPGTSTSVEVRVSDGVLFDGGLVISTASTGAAYFVASSSATRIYFRQADAGTATFDNISVRELPGNHATQSNADARPTLARVPVTGRRNLLTGTDDLATQSVTVTAVEHVLSFFGTGTVTLTGASTAGPLVGTGVDDRVSLTFTPSAGSLTLTVSGDVNFAQLEVA